ncbi:MAG TPA: hypothetical protein VM818_10210 [Vicinamibacterales bacterium]|nr:hypothetical protein [Vicinamibacterales bacterium]
MTVIPRRSWQPADFDARAKITLTAHAAPADTKRMRTSLFFAAITLIAAHASAQEVDIKPQLRAGDEFRLELTRIRENSDRPQANGKGRTLVSVRVVSATPQGFVLDWAPGATVLDNPLAAQDPTVAAASEIVRDMVFRLTLNADGEITGLANQKEIVPKLQALVDKLVQDLSTRLPAEQRQAFQKLTGQILSPATLILSATREAEIYFGLNGVSLAAGEAVEVDLEQPNPFGGGVIPAKFRVDMESATKDSASIKTTTTYDPSVLIRVTQSLAQQAGKPIPPEELAKLPPLQMRDDAKYLFDRTVGLMREVTMDRLVSVEGVRRYDGWQIRLLSGPKR